MWLSTGMKTLVYDKKREVPSLNEGGGKVRRVVLFLPEATVFHASSVPFMI